MQINHEIKERLKKNWGEKADALDCYAEVKFIDPLSSWVCYVYAMDDNEECIDCLIYSDMLGPEISRVSPHLIKTMYNEEGDNPIIDKEYRRTKVSVLLKRLRNDTRRY